MTAKYFFDKFMGFELGATDKAIKLFSYYNMIEFAKAYHEHETKKKKNVKRDSFDKVNKIKYLHD